MGDTSAARPGPMRRGARAGRHIVLVLLVLVLGPPPGPPGRAAPTVGQWDDSLAGSLLVASEKMGDPRFAETVIYMVEHTANSAMGLIVNVPIGAVPAAELFERLGLDGDGVVGEIEVYFGGPVEPGRSFLLHSTDFVFENSIRINDQVALTAQPEMLRALARGAGPAQSVFAFGYAGWGPGQLESELARDAWFVIPPDMSLIFAPNPADTWKRAADRRSLDL